MVKGSLGRLKAPLLACFVLVIPSCSRQPAEQPQSTRKVVSVRAEVFTLPQLFTVELPGPDRWEPVTNARRFEFSPPAVLLLLGKKEPALIRFSLYDSADMTPKALLEQFGDQLAAAGYRCRQVIVPVRADDPASLAFVGPEPELRHGKIFIGRLPGNPKLSVVAIGQWTASADTAVAADFDAIAASLKAAQ